MLHVGKYTRGDELGALRLLEPLAHWQLPLDLSAGALREMKPSIWSSKCSGVFLLNPNEKHVPEKKI